MTRTKTEQRNQKNTDYRILTEPFHRNPPILRVENIPGDKIKFGLRSQPPLTCLTQLISLELFYFDWLSYGRAFDLVALCYIPENLVKPPLGPDFHYHPLCRVPLLLS